MIYLAIIYISGAVLFLMQAHIYAKVSRERIIGALTWPLRKDGELRKWAGRKFWAAHAEWQDLPEDEKQKTRIGGGCVRF